MLLKNNENEDRNCGCNNCNCDNNDECALCNMNYGNGVTKSGANMMDYNCNYDTPQGINAAFGYNTTNMVNNNMDCGCNDNTDECCEERQRVREEMIHQIKSLNFAVIELGLYLNTHNDDQRALCLHREYTNKLKELKDKYQKVYGPLSIYYPCKKWRWLEEPWPWEGGNY